MNIKLRKMLTGFLLICVMAVAGPAGLLTVWAANTKIAFSDPSVMVGNDVSVSVKVTSDSALGSADIMLSYDPSVLEFVSGTNANGGAGAIKLLGTMEAADQKSFSFNLKFKTLQAGSTQIAVTSQEIYDMDSNPVTLDKLGTSTVKVTSPASYSKDAALKSLKISPGTLTPEFSASVESYTASVDSATDNLVVNAVAANANASVSLQGAEGLKIGENQVVVKVTAEDKQTVKNYTITVTKEEGETSSPTEGAGGETEAAQLSDVTVQIGGTDYNIASSFDEAALPEGFEAVTYQYKGTDVMAGKGLEKELMLLYLKDGGGNGGFYIYNETADSWTLYVQLLTSSKAIVIMPYDNKIEMPGEFISRQIYIDENLVDAWVPKDDPDPQYCVVYGMNWNGVIDFYRYDLTEFTVQRYFTDGVSLSKYMETADSYNNLLKDYKIRLYVCFGLGALAVLLLIVIILLLMKKDKGGSPSGSSRGRKGQYSDEHRYGQGESETGYLDMADEDAEDPDSAMNSGAEESHGAGGFRAGSADSSAGNVRRYSREEYEQRSDDDEADIFTGMVKEEESDDFEELPSLEEMEKEMNARHPRKPQRKGRPVKGQQEPVLEAKPARHPKPPKQDQDDDFEMMDLDD